MQLLSDDETTMIPDEPRNCRRSGGASSRTKCCRGAFDFIIKLRLRGTANMNRVCSCVAQTLRNSRLSKVVASTGVLLPPCETMLVCQCQWMRVIGHEGIVGVRQYIELVRRLQSSEPSGKRRAMCLMPLVKHGYVVLLADQEDLFVVGGVDNAIILYRAIEKDETQGQWRLRGGGEERKDILWSSNGPWTMTFLRTDDINRLARESDKEESEQEKTVLFARSTSDSFVVFFPFFVFGEFYSRESRKKREIRKEVYGEINADILLLQCGNILPVSCMNTFGTNRTIILNPFFPCEHLCSLKEGDLYTTFESEFMEYTSFSGQYFPYLDRQHPSRDIVMEPRRRAGGNKDAVRAAKEGRYCASVKLDAGRIVAAMLSGTVHIYYWD
ncbi:hypothetical protein ALC62_08805 [Cyphomyrmex costatus]|uniref:Uncharacterized protein n=1 Tax=Cyphomyrmex costatus TaxID=456900 RepID=A0A195CID5_9HYME|nr:hypothetical protein ALC62_08805 [Cyphomyrmex costatus]